MNDMVNYLYSFIYTPPIDHGARNVNIIYKNLVVLKEFILNNKEKYNEFQKYISVLETKFDSLIFKSIDENYVVDKKTIYLKGTENIETLFKNSLRALAVCLIQDNYKREELDNVADFLYNVSKELDMI